MPLAAQQAAAKLAADLYIFDLDGTLIDATDDILASVNHTLARFGRAPLPRSTVAGHIGHGVRDLLKQTTGFQGADFEQALQIFLAHYYDNCVSLTALYPGVREVLLTLQARGKQLHLCTNKQVEHSEKILRGFGIHQLFSSIIGGNSVPHKKPHPAGVQRILETARIPAVRGVMVGDSHVDIEVGKKVGLYTCGCSYGLRPLAELQAAAPDRMLGSLPELFEHFE